MEETAISLRSFHPVKAERRLPSAFCHISIVRVPQASQVVYSFSACGPPKVRGLEIESA